MTEAVQRRRAAAIRSISSLMTGLVVNGKNCSGAQNVISFPITLGRVSDCVTRGGFTMTS